MKAPEQIKHCYTLKLEGKVILYQRNNVSFLEEPNSVSYLRNYNEVLSVIRYGIENSISDFIFNVGNANQSVSKSTRSCYGFIQKLLYDSMVIGLERNMSPKVYIENSFSDTKGNTIPLGVLTKIVRDISKEKLGVCLNTDNLFLSGFNFVNIDSLFGNIGKEIQALIVSPISPKSSRREKFLCVDFTSFENSKYYSYMMTLS